MTLLQLSQRNVVRARADDSALQVAHSLLDRASASRAVGSEVVVPGLSARDIVGGVSAGDVQIHRAIVGATRSCAAAIGRWAGRGEHHDLLRGRAAIAAALDEGHGIAAHQRGAHASTARRRRAPRSEGPTIPRRRRTSSGEKDGTECAHEERRSNGHGPTSNVTSMHELPRGGNTCQARSVGHNCHGQNRRDFTQLRAPGQEALTSDVVECNYIR